MRVVILTLFVFLIAASAAQAQGPAQKIYETERAFEKMVAEQGIRAGFIEFLAVDGVMFFPEAANGREKWRSRPVSPAALTWNPILIEVSSNGILAYSIGNSIYKPKGKDDTTEYAGHYLSVWIRQANGEYRAVLDTGINHPKGTSAPTEWKASTSSEEKNARSLSAADSSTGFYIAAETGGVEKALKTYLADDAVLIRDGVAPFFGKRAALDFLKKDKSLIKYAKRKSFMESADLAYVHNLYTVVDKSGNVTENGNFVQVWRLRNGKWQIVADILIPIKKTT